MKKTQVHLPEEQLRALHRMAKRQKKSVAAVIRDAIRVALTEDAPTDAGRRPIALWSGELEPTSSDHDSIYDEP